MNENELKTFSGKNIIITGAGSGLGKLLTDRISHFDCQLILLDINQSALLNTLNRFEHRQASFDSYKIDLSSKQEINKLTEEILKKYQRIDILFNNAGIVIGKSILETTQENIEKTFQVNTLAPIFLTKAFLPSMAKNNSGHIINISSASAFTGLPLLADYAASKAALHNFNDSLRLEIAEQNLNIHTTVIAPFYINTGMFHGVKTKFPFILPILNPNDVADKIYDAVISKKSRLILPWSIYTVFLTKLFPIKIYDKILKYLGIISSMKSFNKLNKKKD